MNIQPANMDSSATVFSGIKFRRPIITNNPLLNKNVTAETSKKSSFFKEQLAKLESKMIEWTKNFLEFFENKNTCINEVSQNLEEVSNARRDILSYIA